MACGKRHYRCLILRSLVLVLLFSPDPTGAAEIGWQRRCKQMKFYNAPKPGLNLKLVSLTPDQWRSCVAIICGASDHYDEIADSIKGEVDSGWRRHFRGDMESMWDVIWSTSNLATLSFTQSQVVNAECLLRFEAERVIPALLAHPDTTPEQAERLQAATAQIEFLADQFKNAK